MLYIAAICWWKEVLCYEMQICWVSRFSSARDLFTRFGSNSSWNKNLWSPGIQPMECTSICNHLIRVKTCAVLSTDAVNMVMILLWASKAYLLSHVNHYHLHHYKCYHRYRQNFIQCDHSTAKHFFPILPTLYNNMVYFVPIYWLLKGLNPMYIYI